MKKFIKEYWELVTAFILCVGLLMWIYQSIPDSQLPVLKQALKVGIKGGLVGGFIAAIYILPHMWMWRDLHKGDKK